MSAKYDRVAKTYDRSRKADRHITERLLHHLRPKRAGNYLDIGCGTGNYTAALERAGLSMSGADPSLGMLRTARLSGPGLKLTAAAAECLPFGEAVFEGFVATLTIHHWTDLPAAFGELRRVLKRNARFVIFTSDPGQMRGYWLVHYFPGLLEHAISQMPASVRVLDTLAGAGFGDIGVERYFVRKDLEDLFLYSGKYRPEIYLAEEVRRGISTFSDDPGSVELREGLRDLAADIGSGAIRDVIERYRNDIGDYLFIFGRKT